ncbi:MATE family efflux transporter [Paralimibaculum aggregatum]|uniref:MATE family efflux transporter n=2 Tax=Paralimibaculum aggregatum TaxID=3036245 RepID=A0ABQ6LFY1_9RHOB|nr:MATE family efflux transporter [Limibaculum sp. NKW23]
MRHVAVMTLTGAVGLMALFLVDVANLFYVSLLGPEVLAAAIGFAGTVQFFMISVSIGLSIGAAALVSRAIGAGRRAEARRLAASAAVLNFAVLAAVTAAAWAFRDEILTLLGAGGETHAIASRFLAMVLPALPLLGLGMVSGGLLRAVGDARRAMWITLGGGLLAAALDPLFIFGFGLGIDGAAIVSVIARIVVAGLGLGFAIRRHDLIARPRLADILADAPRLGAISGPAMATQLSTPFGMAYLTTVVAAHGDEAVAGWAVVGRLTALSFGGIFALSGAVGPIFGQNLGAGRGDRLRMVLRDAFLFAAAYVACVWLVLVLLSGSVTAAFGLTGAGVRVFETFVHYGAGAYLFTALLFVANAAFNNLGRPHLSTLFNWSRDALAIPGLALLLGAAAAPEGAVLVQATAAIAVGIAAGFAARAHVARVAARTVPAPAEPAPPHALAVPFTSARTDLPETGEGLAEAPEPAEMAGRPPLAPPEKTG